VLKQGGYQCFSIHIIILHTLDIFAADDSALFVTDDIKL